VAILENDGTPWAWAGRHRLSPQPAATRSPPPGANTT
jgi:hypothetical protein